MRLTLAELEAAARALLSVLLALLDPGVPRQEARLLELLAQLDVEHAERARDAVAQRARPARTTPPPSSMRARRRTSRSSRSPRRAGGPASSAPRGRRSSRPCGLSLSLISPVPGAQVDAGHRCLALARGVVLDRCRAQRCSPSLDGHGLRLLRLVRVLLARVDLELAEHRAAQLGLGQHAADGFLDQARSGAS